MAFPETPRVHYENNPLDEVICQLRFPAILKIDSEAPAAFQEKIRSKYPIYQSLPAIQFPPELPQPVAAMIAKDFGGQNSHEFMSEDQNWKLSLTREFLALTCRKYDRWDSFKEYLKIGVDALQDIYVTSFYTRVGLRYRDIIRRSKWGIGDKPWNTLLQPGIAGALASTEISEDIQHIAHQLVVKLPADDSFVQVNHGLNRDHQTNEPTYLIDMDLYTNRTETTDVISQLDFLNKQSRYLFRWCITDELYSAMRPTVISSN